ncbi:hypothetical protein GF352_02745 [archaeon]|nr:hypothetical protein [archaeon]
MGLIKKIRQWFKDDDLTRFLRKQGLKPNEVSRELLNNYVRFLKTIGSFKEDSGGYFTEEKIKSVFAKFDVEIKDVDELSAELTELNSFYPRLNELLNKILVPVCNNYHGVKGYCSEIEQEFLDLTNSNNGLINDFAAYREEFGVFKAGIIELFSTGVLPLRNDFKLFIYTLSQEADRKSDLMNNFYREGLVDKSINDFISLTTDLGLIKQVNGLYELTSEGEQLLPYCEDCERIDYLELIDKVVCKWGDYLKAIEIRDNTKDDDNERLVMYRETFSLLKRLCPDNRKVQRDFEKEWNVIKRCVRLEYNNGSHSLNYRRNEVAVKEILKIMNKVRDDYLKESQLIPEV